MDTKPNTPTDPQEFINFLNEETQKLFEMFSVKNQEDFFSNFTKSWTELATRSWEDPTVWIRAISDYQQGQMNLWRNILTGGATVNPVASPAPGDRRFQAEEWSQNPVFDYIKQSYLLTSQLMSEMAANANLSDGEQRKLEFYTQQYIDAMSPTNFAMTNPEVLHQALETKGQSLIDGMKNLLSDADKGRISMTDESAFELGKNLALTEGSVVFENEMLQLIQYKPTQAQVFERPTLIIPPCINKFYIMDLQEHNSYVKYCVEQGQNTFLISWTNPREDQSYLSWDDYIEKGILEAIEAVKSVGASSKINTVSWCVGGTLTATALAVMANRKDNSVASATFLTTLTDFADPGDIGVFVDEQQVSQLVEKVNDEGFLNGRSLANSFNMLRSNDLIWSYVVNNYLKGQTPPPFDILYWNSDSTNLPATMYTFYMKEMYLENKLSQPGGLTICGEEIDLGKIKTPVYFLSTIEDHIAPWKGTFKGTELMKGQVEFVLGASGHVAGVINPASKNRRHFWTGGKLGDGAENWLESAERQEGSWWNHWSEWLKKRAGKKVDAPAVLGNATYKEIEPAPGRYVKVRLA